MEHDPRLVARSESHTGTRRIRPDAAKPIEPSARSRGPQVDPDELVAARDAEIASGRCWRVRLDHSGLWWDSIGGYTPHTSNAKKWTSRWDAYNHMLEQRTGDHTWDIELIPQPGAASRGLTSGLKRDDLVQAWTRSVPREGRPAPEDGLVHALAGVSVPGWALCGESVGVYTDHPWPPRGMRRCERCNSLAMGLPRD
ncbi:hypothetical protein GXB85_13545 [Cellulomonas sp. APG4]|uniref:hypothetical protein n=1 Tax=Cellulomonas sp. APG4 TaxID=1538656 RepID=UPI00137AB262|nr:hypothetical protein [Cellulomonas sp. APG4]NCT91966.1 hypothetical protein [Cellulomonas sp. APG4]